MIVDELVFRLLRSDAAAAIRGAGAARSRRREHRQGDPLHPRQRPPRSDGRAGGAPRRHEPVALRAPVPRGRARQPDALPEAAAHGRGAAADARRRAARRRGGGARRLRERRRTSRETSRRSSALRRPPTCNAGATHARAARAVAIAGLGNRTAVAAIARRPGHRYNRFVFFAVSHQRRNRCARWSFPNSTNPGSCASSPTRGPRPGQVLIRVHASGMCGTDLHVHHGMFPLKPPIVAGHEPAGEIVELGAGVTDLRVGDRVGAFWNQKGCGRCEACQSGRPRTTASNAQSWMNLGGGNSELMLAWASGVRADPRRGVVRGGGADLLRRLHGDERPAQRRPEAGRAGRGARRRRARPPGGAAGEGGRPRDVRDHRAGRQEGGAARARAPTRCCWPATTRAACCATRAART